VSEPPVQTEARILSNRFQIVRELGSGEFGTVYEAYDLAHRERLAIKVLHRMGADALYRFKAEFRSLRDVSHPNLVQLGELHHAEGTWFFTMELVEGRSFSSLVQASARTLSRVVGRDAAEARLRQAFTELVYALSACHASQRVHCDVKPENVRMDAAGRVVLLDFGLVLSADAEGRFTRHASGGTLAYMAPEQAHGLPVGPAADFYSVGVMLYEALTGYLPFGDAADLRSQGELAVAPRTIAPALPQDLSDLAVALLAYDPEQRPSSDEVRARLAGAGPRPKGHAPDLAPAVDPDVFVGRSRELTLLENAWAEVRTGRVALIYIEGDSGMGKTALAEHFVRRAQAKDPRTLALRGRCYEREAVPYKAFDGVFDQLADYLRGLPAAVCQPLLPRRPALVRQMFPVLGRVPAVAEAPVAALPRDPSMLREQAFIAVRELLGRVAEHAPLIMLIEDLQWTDLDSLMFMESLVEALDPPACLVLVTARTAQEQPVDLALRVEQSVARGGATRLVLGALESSEAAQLAQRLLDGEGEPALASQLAGEAAGHPMFIAELAAHARSHVEMGLDRMRLEDAIGIRIRKLSQELRATLDYLAIAGSPVSHEVLANALQISELALARHLAVLRGLRLARTVTSYASDCHHDRVRAAVLSESDRADRVRLARRLAIAMATIEVEEDRVAELWCLADEPDRAARLWPIAAQRAAENLAFDRAAQLYARALDPGPDEADMRLPLELARAGVLVGAGQLSEAASIYLAAAEKVERGEARKLKALAVQCLLQSGQTSEGLELAERTFREVGLSLPQGNPAAIWAVVWHRSLLRLSGLEFRARAKGEQDVEIGARLDMLWAVAPSLVYVSIWQGAALTAQHLRLALKGGSLEHVTRGLTQEGLFLSAVEPYPQRRSLELLERATALANAQDNPQLSALTSLVRANYHMGRGDFRDATTVFDSSERLLQERCTHVTWELTVARAGGLAARVLSGALREHGQRAALWGREARDRGDRYAEAMFASAGMSWYSHLLHDCPSLAVSELDAILPQERPSILTALGVVGYITIGLHAKDGDLYDRLLPQTKFLRSKQLLRASLVNFSINMTMGTAAVLRAKDLAGSDRRKWVQTIRSHAARTIHVSPALLQAVREHLLAQAAQLEGDLDTAVTLYRSAVANHERADWINLHSARFGLGRLIGGTEGAGLVAEALHWARSQGFVRPEAFLQAWSPLSD